LRGGSSELSDLGRFPFGEPVRRVVQADRGEKRAFVLGVYASAVHARWVGRDGGNLVKALAVASEPEIFWRGEREAAEEIIGAIPVPEQAGRLTPADSMFNGPSGVALDERILRPLGLDRSECWLCDLVPYSCSNDNQRAAIENHYRPLVAELGLPEPSVPEVPRKLADDARRREILDELDASAARLLILLGDEPIKHFMRPLVGEWTRLSAFEDYGRLHRVTLDGRALFALPLAHPRQVARLGRHSREWFEQHQGWIDHVAAGLELP
jgi:uracil-DNA glycosylase